MTMDYYDTVELAAAVVGYDVESEDGFDEDVIESELMEKLNVDLEEFGRIAEVLMPMCMVSKSPLTGRVYRGFAKGDYFIVKQEVK